MKKKFIDYFMEMAELTASLSYATRLQVGALIVKGNRIIGTGYNGMPTDWDNECEVDGVIQHRSWLPSHRPQLPQGFWREKRTCNPRHS